MVSEDIVLEVIAKALERKSVNIGCSLTFLDLESEQKATKVANALNKKFKLNLTCNCILKMISLKDIVTFVVKNGCSKPSGSHNRETVSNSLLVFKKLTANLKKFNNNYDRIVFPVIPNFTLSKIRREHKLDVSIEIFYYREYDSKTTFIITERGLSYCDMDKQKIEQYDWTKIDRVEHSPKENVFYIYFSENCDLFDYYSDYMLLKDGDRDECRYFAKILTDVAKNFEDIEANLLDEVILLKDENKLTQALEVIDKLLALNSEDPSYHFIKGRILVEILNEQDIPDEVQVNLAEKELGIAMDTMEKEDLKTYSPVMNLMQGLIYEMRGQIYNARNSYVLAMEAEDRELKEEAKEYYQRAEDGLKNIWDSYTEVYDYKDRKFIMPVRDISGCFASDIEVFRLNNIPSCFHFPTGHPVANELYIGHPYSSSVYIPYEGSENAFFLDKIEELCYILQCLGATEISITSLKGKSVSELNSSTTHIDADVSTKIFSGSASYDGKFESEKDSQSNESLTLTLKFDPLKPPHLPEDLVWYPVQTSWKRLVQQRIDGNMLEYHQTISTSETRFVSSAEENEIKASAKLVWSKANSSYQGTFDTKFKQSVETVWKVDVKFRSVSDFDKVGKSESGASQRTKESSCLTESESKYKEEVLFCLEDDGIISETEHSFLERKRTKLGITSERALEIEHACIAEVMTVEEKEYVEELKAVMINGVIPDNTRRLLDRVRCSLDITEVRAKALEQNLVK